MTDSITRFAQHYRLEAAAVLVQIAKDETAPPQARAAAAEKILAYSDGRPGAPRPVTVADLELMTDEQRQDLLHALLTRYEVEMPGQFKQMMVDAYTEAMARMSLSQPRPCRFTRGTPPTLIAQPENGRSTPSSLKIEAAAPAGAPARIAHERAAQAPAGNDNIVPLPLPLGTHEPFRELEPITNGSANDAPTSNGMIHPDVLVRSALPGQLALDSAFRGYSYPWRKS